MVRWIALVGFLEKWKAIHISLFYVAIRVLFFVFAPFDHYELATDSYRIHELVDQTLQGNFDYDIGRFIVAPLYPFFWASQKWLFPNHWELALLFIQWLIQAIGGVYLWRLGLMLFNKKVAVLASLFYGLYPFAVLWSATFSSEAVFPSVFIGAIYFLVKAFQFNKWRDVIRSACFFSLSFLLKSHVLLFAPFVVIYFFTKKGHAFIALRHSLIYAAICLLFTLPYGIYSYKHYGVYVLSSNGAPFHFYTGNSEFGYRTVVEVPEQGSEDFMALQKMEFARFNGPVHDSIMQLSQKEKQGLYANQARLWIKENPGKFIEMKGYNAAFFVLPGFSFRHYPLPTWLFSFLIMLPIYIGAYFMIWKLRGIHRFMRGMFWSMALFAIVFYVQNRFRTLTLEPFYILYATAFWFSRGDSFRPSES